MRGWNKDEQRAVFQPVMLAAIVMTVISLTASGSITGKRSNYICWDCPRFWPGSGSDFKLYGKLDDAAFRKVVLLLLLVAGFALTAAAGWPILRPGGGDDCSHDIRDVCSRHPKPACRGLSRNVCQPDRVLADGIGGNQAQPRSRAGKERLAATQHLGVQVQAILVDEAEVGQAPRQFRSGNRNLSGKPSLQVAHYPLDT